MSALRCVESSTQPATQFYITGIIEDIWEQANNCNLNPPVLWGSELSLEDEILFGVNLQVGKSLADFEADEIALLLPISQMIEAIVDQNLFHWLQGSVCELALGFVSGVWRQAK